jgi:cyclic pyranopterin phosphate synthase
MQDKFQRNICYLRLSLTKVCNFRCQYCLPESGYWGKEPDYLNLDEIENLLTAMTELGVTKVRLTGGEPTVRKDFLSIANLVGNISAVTTLAMSTNGYSLQKNAAAFYAAGIRHINISVDHLQNEQFFKITGNNGLDRILNGIEQCLDLNFTSIKMNAVLLKDLNDSEATLQEFLNYIKNRPITVRFIELMKTQDHNSFYAERYRSVTHIIEFLKRNHWTQIVRPHDAGPAVEFSHSNYAGKIGVISPYSNIFCASCNRIRVTATGELHVCLFSEQGVKLRPLLQNPSQKTELKQLILHAISNKGQSHQLHQEKIGRQQHFSSMGG